MFRIEAGKTKIKMWGDTWMWHLWGTVGWSSFNQGWFKSRAVSSREQGQKVGALGKACTFSLISQLRRMRNRLRSTSPLFLSILVANAAIAESQIKKQKEDPRDPRIIEAARLYETYFLNQMYKGMRGTVQLTDNPSMTTKIYTEQLDEHTTDEWAKSGGIGLSDMIYDQIVDRYAQAAAMKQRQNEFKLFGRKAIPFTGRDIIRVQPLPNRETVQREFVNVRPTQNPSDPQEIRAPVAGILVDISSVVPDVKVSIEQDDGQVLTLSWQGELQNGEHELKSGTRIEAGKLLGKLQKSAPGVLLSQVYKTAFAPGPKPGQQDSSKASQESLEQKAL